MLLALWRISKKTESPDLQRPHSFLQGFLEGPADGHGFSYGLHGGREPVFGARKFLKSPSGYLDHAVVNRRFKGSESLPRDVVCDLVKRVPEGKFGRYLCDWKSRGFRSQGGTSGNPRIHLDHHHLAGVRVNGELDIRAARFNSDFPDDGDGRTAHGLVFPVGQGLSRGHGDAIPRVNAHGVEVLD